MSGGSLTLPFPLHGYVERTAAARLQPRDMPAFDFAAPPTALALIPAESVSWRVFKNPVTLFIGGVAAVILELAEPRVRDGVWQNSSFRRDPLTRLQRTGLAAMITVYGAREKAEEMIARVGRMHGRVAGTTSEGESYRADDPVLLNWVQATASFGFLEAYSEYCCRLSPDALDRGYAEGAVAARLYGATGAPTSRAELDALFERMGPDLAPSPIIDEFLTIMARVRALPPGGGPVQRLLLRAAIDLVPWWVRWRIGLGADRGLSRSRRMVVRALARGADRLLLRSSPVVQASRRLGLPDDYVWRVAAQSSS